ncbi:MAG: sulfatase-like hydrolase/transferase, partial [Actinomycetota bacterium]
LILVVFDTARADGFEPWGAPAGSTPVAADLARRGTAPSLAIAPSNWTLPSHASMFTGMLPGALGLTSGTKAGSKAGLNSAALLEAHSDRVLAEVLRRRGYTTAGVSANPWIHRVNGFATGFENFVSIKAMPRKPLGKGLRSRLEWAVDAWRARADDGATEARAILRKWMDELGGGSPFFWFVNLMECHSPYQPPRPFNDLSGLDRIRAAADAAKYQTPHGAYRVCVGELHMNEATLVRTRRLYARAIYQMDAWLGGLLEDLERRRILNDTVVILASDHGENLGEQGLIGHVLSMSERLLRVPLVFSTPIAGLQEEPVSLAQLPALAAGALGLAGDEHPWHDEVKPGGLVISQV